MLLRATEPARWSAKELAQRLYVPPALAHEVMAYLCHARILECDDLSLSYAFSPKSPELKGVTDALALQYACNLVHITKLIHSKSDRQAQQFVDAFNLRPEK